MAPNIHHLPSIPVPEEQADSRIRCAILGCGMVRSHLQVVVVENEKMASHIIIINRYLLF
jgi:hypothetical protein